MVLEQKVENRNLRTERNQFIEIFEESFNISSSEISPEIQEFLGKEAQLKIYRKTLIKTVIMKKAYK